MGGGKLEGTWSGVVGAMEACGMRVSLKIERWEEKQHFDRIRGR